MNKKELRKYIKEIKKAHSNDVCAFYSELIKSKILEHQRIGTTETVICFWSMDDEIDTHQLTVELAKLGKRVLLPKVISDHDMTLHEFHSMSDLTPGAYGIMEPVTPAIPFHDIYPTAVCITPGVAFTCNGKRLGRGKGYYDRMFLQLPDIYKIGICYPFQIVEDLPTDPHDVRMNEVITNCAVE